MSAQCSGKRSSWDVPGGPVVRIQHFHSQGPGFSSWSGNYDRASLRGQPKHKNKKPALGEAKCKQIIYKLNTSTQHTEVQRGVLTAQRSEDHTSECGGVRLHLN